MRFLAIIGALAIIAAISAAIFFLGGGYNVAGTSEEPSIVNWTLVYVRAASIEKRANNQAPNSLDDPSVVQVGARAFATRGCLMCHGGPGVKWAKFTEGMRPYPPNLKEISPERTAPQIFWVVKNGIKMTGMPSFGLIGVPDQEIWALAAFVKKLPNVSDADFKAWTSGP
jgi:Cytochrome C oxidase, cbb3-type, subunit III